MTIIYKNVVGNLEVYMDVMRAICGDTAGKSMIDLCCCTAPNTPTLGFEKRRYIDVVDRVLDHKDEQQFFTKMNVLDLGYLLTWDVAICSDGIEHLSITEGIKLKRWMNDNALKTIFFTPLDNIFGLVEEDNSDPEAHRSLWSPEWFPMYGTIIFPDYHKAWNGGAFFTFKCRGLAETGKEFKRVKEELATKHWAQ